MAGKERLGYLPERPERPGPVAAAGARMVNFVEYRFIDIDAGLPTFQRRRE
jgi:hypothetical protein